MLITKANAKENLGEVVCLSNTKRKRKNTHTHTFSIVIVSVQMVVAIADTLSGMIRANRFARFALIG